MNFYLYATFNLTIFLAGVLALFRFRRISKVYYPFLFCLWIGSLNEALSVFLAVHKHQSLVNNNIYVLIEALLLTWFFNKINLLTKRNFFVLSALLLLTWMTENFVLGSIAQNSTYFRIIASFAVVFMSISTINAFIFSNRRQLFKDATFLLSFSFLVYFTYKAFVLAFVVYGTGRNGRFLYYIYSVMIYINLAANLLYAVAVLWMPRKARFLSPFSLRS